MRDLTLLADDLDALEVVPVFFTILAHDMSKFV